VPTHTLTSRSYQIILVLLQQWLANPAFVPSSPRIRKRRLSLATHGLIPDMGSGDPPIRRQSYPVINSMAVMRPPSPLSSVNVSLDLLRVIRKGPAVKAAVDDAIDQCAEVLNLRDSIEEARIRAEQVTDQREKRSLAQRGQFHPYWWSDVPLMIQRPSKSAAILRAHRFPGILTVHRAGYPTDVPDF